MTYKPPHSLDRPVRKEDYKITVQWHCFYYIGSHKWQTTEIYEPDECDTEFVTLESKESWEAGQEMGVITDDL